MANSGPPLDPQLLNEHFPSERLIRVRKQHTVGAEVFVAGTTPSLVVRPCLVTSPTLPPLFLHAFPSCGPRNAS